MMGRYLRPTELADATRALAGHPYTILAGGTDFYPARVGRAIGENVLDISRLSELGGIREHDDHWRLGALLTWSELIDATLPGQFDGLKAAAREVGGRQIQNMGTLAGNLCNASPAADGTPNLLALEAMIELASSARTRQLPVGAFVLGNRRTACRPDEIVTALLVPKRGNRCRSSFVKLGARAYLVISIVMVAVVIEPGSDKCVERARIAVGSCNAVAQRLPDLERDLAGAPFGPALRAILTPHHLAPLAPLSDVRGRAGYRLAAAQVLLGDALDAAAGAP